MSAISDLVDCLVTRGMSAGAAAEMVFAANNEAVAAQKTKTSGAERTRKWREKKALERDAVTSQNVTDVTETDVTSHVTEANKKEKSPTPPKEKTPSSELKESSSEARWPNSVARAAEAELMTEAIRRPTYTDSRHELFGEGVPMLVQLGLTNSRARTMIGRWLRDAKDDAQAVLGIIQRARDHRPHDPIPWITQGINTGKPNGSHPTQPQQSPMQAATAEMRSRLRVGSNRPADVGLPEGGLFRSDEVHGPIVDHIGTVPPRGGRACDGPPDGHPAAFEMAASDSRGR